MHNNFKKNKILLNPGPTNTSYNTKMAQLIGSDICHRTEDFYDVLRATKKLLLERFLLESKHQSIDDWEIALIGGSGTTAMEALVGSLCPSTQVHTVVAGKYGQRLCDMMDVYHLKYQEIKAQTIEDLERKNEVTHLFFVENETTTGEKFAVATVHNNYPHAKLFIDATSAFGASNYASILSSIAAISFCSNKCLQSTPGLGIVIWRKELMTYKRNYYFDLTKYTTNIPPFTVPVQSVYALHSALQEHPDNTSLFNKRSKKIIADFAEIGIPCINKFPSNAIMGFAHPTKTYEELRSFLLRRDIVIYSGIEGYKNSFRIATMSVEFDNKYPNIINIFHESVH